MRQVAGMAYAASGLADLDRRFLRLKDAEKGWKLMGMSLVETRGYLGLPKIVQAESATRYFSIWHRIPKANHSQVVKPDMDTHLSHVYLRDFALEFGFSLSQREKTTEQS
jgi:hypothetical protein